jgi:protein associated with RNAse G/E
VVSKKYDGSLRDVYEAYLVNATTEIVTLLSEPGTISWSPQKQLREEAPDGLIEIYFTRSWFNVWHICEQSSGWNKSYINIATPATFFDDRLEWVDLDIDYRLHLDDSVEKLDVEEFDENRELMGYPDDLVDKVQSTRRKVEAGLAAKVFPFDHDAQVERYYHIKRTVLTDC